MPFLEETVSQGSFFNFYVSVFSLTLSTHVLGAWRLEYDASVAHAFLCTVRGSAKAMQEGAKGVDRRCRQAAAFLSDMPSTIENFASVSSLPFYKESKEADNQIDQKRGMLMDMFFRDPAVSDARSVMDAFLQLKPIHFRGAMHGYSLVVSRVSSYHELCSHVVQKYRERVYGNHT